MIKGDGKAAGSLCRSHGLLKYLAWFNSMLAYQDRACTANYATIYCKSIGWNVIEVPRYLPFCSWASFCACVWASFCACVLLRHPLGRTSSDKTCKEPCDCIRQCLGQKDKIRTSFPWTWASFGGPSLAPGLSWKGWSLNHFKSTSK